MKITLVPYPISYDLRPDAPEDQYLPIGLLTVGAILERAGHKVTIIGPAQDSGAALEPVPSHPDVLARRIRDTAPDMVGFSTICSSYPLTVRWAERFHALSSDVPIILGGPQATITDEETLKAFPWIYAVLRGEVENSILELVSCLEHRRNLASVPGLTWRFGDEIMRNPDAPLCLDLDALPEPAYHLYPFKKLLCSIEADGSSYKYEFPLEAGRGCPFNCTFCSTSGFFHRRYRVKPVGRLIREMTELHEQYGIETFSLKHDLFTVSKAYILEFCRELRAKGLDNKIRWNCSSRTDTLDPLILSEMASAGCTTIFYGIETGSPRMQKLIGKNLDLDDAKSIVRATLSSGIQPVTSFVTGFPEERREDLAATLALMLDLLNEGVNDVQLHLLSPLVGSELFNSCGKTIYFDSEWCGLSYTILSPEDLEMVRAYPGVFASFYRFETPHVDSDVFQAASGIIYFNPHLMAALSAGGVDLMSAFDRWPAWYRTRVRHRDDAYYYRQPAFRQDFLTFLEQMMRADSRVPSGMIELVHYYVVSGESER
jgi:radical SAM superfamily enzyme YgiQ (UPF0313 family)